MPREVEVVMPQMGESLAEGTVVKWLKAHGDAVARDEPLFEISTDKVDTDVPAPMAGVLTRILVQEGQTIAVGSAVAVLEVRDAATPNASRAAAPDGASSDRMAGPGEEPARPGESPPAAAAGSTGAPPDEPPGHFKSSHAPQLVSFRRGPTAAPKADPLPAPARPAPRATEPPGAGAASRTFSPAVLDAARRGGVPLGTLTSLRGSGRGGRITRRDVLAYLAEPSPPPTTGAGIDLTPHRHVPAGSGAATAMGADPIPREYLYRPDPEDQVQPMSPIRRAIARHMTWSMRISPHATSFAECDMSAAAARLAATRDAFRDQTGARLTYTVLAAEALVTALREFPILNASVVDDSLVLKPHVHLGIAVALGDTDELIVPVIKRAEELDLPGLARALADLAARARDRRLRPEDVQGGTFTMTNPGMFGGITGTPILHQPQVAILGLGAITNRAVVIDDRIGIRPMMTLSLTFDHRAVDGMMSFRFLERFRQRIETR